MKKALIKLCTGMFCFLMLLIVVVPLSLAWYRDNIVTLPGFHGSVTYMLKYFESGDGTKDTPYIIKTPDQLYNLAWLQYMGYFDKVTTYFKLSDDITILDMDTYALPPIGTTTHPFIGNFDGNMKTIKNLWISSNYDEWKSPPPYIRNANKVGTDIGFFGNIKGEDAGEGETTVSVGVAKNFYLDNIKVTTDVNNSTVGIIAGMIDGTVDSIGVNDAKIEVRDQTSVQSEYSLIGKVVGGVIWVDRPQGDRNGDLKVIPTLPSYAAVGSGANGSVLAGAKPGVPGAVTDENGNPAARVIGAVNRIEPKPQPDANSVYLFGNTDLQFGQTYKITKGTANGDTSSLDAEFWDSAVIELSGTSSGNSVLTYDASISDHKVAVEYTSGSGINITKSGPDVAGAASTSNAFALMSTPDLDVLPVDQNIWRLCLAQRSTVKRWKRGSV